MIIIKRNFKDFGIFFQNIKNNKYMLKSLLHLIENISSNHFRIKNFWSKIEAILLLIKDEIIKYFSNEEIFSLFKELKKTACFQIKLKQLLHVLSKKNWKNAE